jgi:Lrp/AsnC family transcriptional regulator, leucine-responsive regulatory protein
LLSYEPASELLDDVNLHLLAELGREPRPPMTELARRVGMSAPAVTERVRRLEEAGMIREVCLDIDPAASCRFWKGHPSLT